MNAIKDHVELIYIVACITILYKTAQAALL